MPFIVTGISQDGNTSAIESSLKAAGLSLEPFDILGPDDADVSVSSGGLVDTAILTGGGLETGTGVPGLTGGTRRCGTAVYRLDRAAVRSGTGLPTSRSPTMKSRTTLRRSRPAAASLPTTARRATSRRSRDFFATAA